MTYRPARPRLIFANLVNRHMIENPTLEYARSLGAVAHRKLWLAYEGDVVITPQPIPSSFRGYVCDLLGLHDDTLTLLSPQAGVTELLADAVSRSEVSTDVETLANRDDLEMLPFAPDEATVSLARRWELPLAGYETFPAPEVLDLIAALNTKSRFREVVAGLGLPTLPGMSCRGSSTLTAAAIDIVARYGGAIVKCDRSSNGYGHLVLRPGDDIDATVRGHLARIRQPNAFTVEALASFVSVPSVEMIVDDHGVRLLYVCDQRCPNSSFSGMETPPRELAPEGVRALEHAGRVFGEFLHASGVRSVFDVDAGITSAGELYVTETNLRRTGGTYLDTLVRRLVGDPYDQRCVWIADSRSAGHLTDFGEGYRRLDAAKLGFDGNSGVVLTADTLHVDGKWRYLVIAPSAVDADLMEKEAATVLGFDL